MVIVAAVNESSGEDLLYEAKKLAVDREIELHVVYVIGESKFRKLEQASVAETNQSVDISTIREFAKNTATNIASKSISEYKPVGLEGDEPTRITQYAAREKADYIVIGGRKRNPVGKAVFGSVSQSVLLNAECPVMFVK